MSTRRRRRRAKRLGRRRNGRHEGSHRWRLRRLVRWGRGGHWRRRLLLRTIEACTAGGGTPLRSTVAKPVGWCPKAAGSRGGGKAAACILACLRVSTRGGSVPCTPRVLLLAKAGLRRLTKAVRLLLRLTIRRLLCLAVLLLGLRHRRFGSIRRRSRVARQVRVVRSRLDVGKVGYRQARLPRRCQRATKSHQSRRGRRVQGTNGTQVRRVTPSGAHGRRQQADLGHRGSELRQPRCRSSSSEGRQPHIRSSRRVARCNVARDGGFRGGVPCQGIVLALYYLGCDGTGRGRQLRPT